MSKERLEEILKILPYSIRYAGELEELVSFAKEQAERVQELEKLIEKADEHAVRNGKEIMKLTDERNRIDFQNKRYRELLNKVAYEDIDFQQTVNIVRKELEGKEWKTLRIIYPELFETCKMK